MNAPGLQGFDARSAALVYLYALLLNAYRCKSSPETTSVLRERVAAESKSALLMARAFGV